ncbi:pilus assembly protein [Alloscardovia theropitheci]|uniref:Pilus assembly protein n=1 Tax=Alloscardovia theropitheci TaxID=2496842 RepID=A0A4R0QQH2_9BIFI|nr:ATPase, T2SS/T4P/T4SS family [Alloscardovia theropitheci]TCD54544.1 pilus assembly protein [Alloscardovia theropitheci]
METIFGPLSTIASEPGVTDIAVTSDGRIWCDKGQGMVERSLVSGRLSAEILRNFAIQLCASFGKRLDDACPIADASSPDGIRIHAILEPIVSQGASLSIRFPQQSLVTLESLERAGMFPKQWRELLELIIRTRQSILICGGTGAGKTTLVKALLSAMPASERVVLIEETRELHQSIHDNGESLVVRQANIEGAGEVTLSDLVKATVRMRPDRIILGECRGEEISDLLRALNSGHKGSIATIHADSVERVPSRLCALGLLAQIDTQAMSLLAAGAFDVVIHVVRDTAGRRIAHVGRLKVDSHNSLYGEVLASWDGINDGHDTHMRVSSEYERWVGALRTQDDGELSDGTLEFSRVKKV